MSEDVYTRLREFLDAMPGGFPATGTGVELKILKKLYSPEDAELTILKFRGFNRYCSRKFFWSMEFLPFPLTPKFQQAGNYIF